MLGGYVPFVISHENTTTLQDGECYDKWSCFSWHSYIVNRLICLWDNEIMVTFMIHERIPEGAAVPLCDDVQSDWV